MRKILVTGGTVFVSRFIAEHYVAKGDEVYVLNRNTRPQSAAVKLIQADRHAIGDALQGLHFDLVVDTAYTWEDAADLLNALESYEDYVLISSSAVYPEYAPAPFTEETQLAENVHWGAYGTNKIAAETALMERNPKAYILRPPYLYGPMNNVYREAFVFDCALENRKFYLPREGSMKLQFFHVEDLCRFIDILVERHPKQHIFNVGNKESISIRDWVTLCYQAAGKQAEFVEVTAEEEQRNYFSFYNYEYALDVTKQLALMSGTKPLADGLKEAYDWYVVNQDKVNKKPYLAYIEKHLA